MYATPTRDNSGHVIQTILALQGEKPTWVFQKEGNEFKLRQTQNLSSALEILDVTPALVKFQKDVDNSAPRPVNIAPGPNFDWQNPAYPLLAIQHLPIADLHLYLVSLVLYNEFLSTASIQMMETEFGIYPWHFDLERNQFHFPLEASRTIFGEENQPVDYQLFYSSISSESLSRFSHAMEGAINFGRPFKMELLLEIGTSLKWISFSCRKTPDQHSKGWLSGFIKDLTLEKQKQTKDEKINLWLNAGVASMKVLDSENQVIQEWGSSFIPSGTQFENGKRTTPLFDFRNQPKYTLSIDIGAPNPTGRQKTGKAEPDTPEALLLPDLSGKAPDHQYILIAEWIGKSLKVETTALGYWDGKIFGWKAWWKNPARYYRTAALQEWQPPIDWLNEVSTDIPDGFEPGWWPQDLLPFEIGNEFKNGWMLLAEPIAHSKALILAVRSEEALDLMSKKAIARQGLIRLLGSQAEKQPDIKALQEELAFKNLLIKELNHRAKNNLAIVSSMLKMQAGYSENKETKEILLQTRTRLETLASLHELLYQSSDEGRIVQMEIYLERLVNGISKGFGNENLVLVLDVDRVDLPIRTATTVGLLVNELITNSFKHAWLPDAEKKLELSFKMVGKLIQLGVSDNGTGMSNPKIPHESLGQLLIQEFVTQLGATMDVSNVDGTRYFIQFSVQP